jgi:hypothetical protein
MERYMLIDRGHQPRKEAKSKIETARVWKIEPANGHYFRCKPLLEAV